MKIYDSLTLSLENTETGKVFKMEAILRVPIVNREKFTKEFSIFVDSFLKNEEEDIIKGALGKQ